MQGVTFPRKKRYECVQCNVINVTRGWVGVNSPEKKRYVTLEWLLITEDKKQTCHPYLHCFPRLCDSLTGSQVSLYPKT